MILMEFTEKRESREHVSSFECMTHVFDFIPVKSHFVSTFRSDQVIALSKSDWRSCVLNSVL